MMAFVECTVCAAKLGSPTLCEPCLRNRTHIATLEAENARLREALKPFSEVSTVLIDDESIGWDAGMHNARISDWIGPSDLIAARAALGDTHD